MDLAKVTFVLHRPSSAENIGAVARAMKNFGLAALTIVAPPSWTGLPRGGGEGSARDEVLSRARKTARHAVDVLEGAVIHADVRAALATATWACGTSSRDLPGRPSLSPRVLARELRLRSARGVVAVVFGEERRGLSDRELSLCQAVCRIPTEGAYDSMNLAQACAVVAYEVALERGAGGEDPDTQRAPSGDPARHEALEAFWERLAALLAATGYLNPQNPEHILAEWRQLLARAEPTQREIELLLAAVRSVVRKVGC
jgi:tRNA/rRNA methyltransferase